MPRRSACRLRTIRGANPARLLAGLGLVVQEMVLGIESRQLEDFAAQIYHWITGNGNGNGIRRPATATAYGDRHRHRSRGVATRPTSPIPTGTCGRSPAVRIPAGLLNSGAAGLSLATRIGDRFLVLGALERLSPKTELIQAILARIHAGYCATQRLKIFGVPLPGTTRSDDQYVFTHLSPSLRMSIVKCAYIIR